MNHNIDAYQKPDNLESLRQSESLYRLLFWVSRILSQVPVVALHQNVKLFPNLSEHPCPPFNYYGLLWVRDELKFKE